MNSTDDPRFLHSDPNPGAWLGRLTTQITLVAFCVLCTLGLTNFLLLYATIRRRLGTDVFSTILVSNVAMANCALIVSIPATISYMVVKSWQWGLVACKMYWMFEQSNKFTSILFLCLLCVDRFLVIVGRYQGGRLRTARNGLIISAVVWAVSVCGLSPVAKFAEVRPLTNRSTQICAIFWPTDQAHVERYYSYALFSLLYVIPTAINLSLYTAVLIKVRSSISFAGHREPTRQGSQSHRFRYHRTTLTILLIMLFHVFCWSPFWFINLAGMLRGHQKPTPAYTVIIRLIQLLPYLYCSLLPFFQAITSRRFGAIICCCCQGCFHEWTYEQTTTAAAGQQNKVVREGAGGLKLTNKKYRLVLERQSQKKHTTHIVSSRV